MNRTGLAGILLAVILAAAGCTPAADRDLDYEHVDEAFLDESVVVVATSRQENAAEMLGSTLFVDTKGSIKRIDNSGMDMVSLAHEDGRIGFSDVHRDYILGRGSVISEREPMEGSLHRSVFLAGEMVSFINGGFGENFYEMPVLRTGTANGFDLRRGFPWGLDTCGDEVWAYVSPDDDEDESGPIAGVRRIEPWSEEMWTVATDEESIDGSEVSCDGEQLVALGATETGDQYRDVVIRMNITTGAGAITPITGHLVAAKGNDEDVTYWAPKLEGTTLYTVVTFRTDSTERFELVKIDTESGESSKIIEIPNTADEGTIFRAESNVLYVLDVTSKKPSTVRAFTLTNGNDLGSVSFDPIDAEVNSLTTGFEEKQIVRDFVVLNPQALEDDTKPERQ